MRSRVSRLTLLVLAGMVIAAGACGGDDDSDDEESSDGDTTTTEADDEESSSSGGDATEEEYLAAIVESLEGSEDGGFGDTATNECVAGVYVDILGLESLQAAATPEEVAAPETEPEDFGLTIDPAALWAPLKDCVDIESLLFSQYSGGDPTITDCMLAATTEDQRQALFVAFYNEEAAPDPAVLAPIESAATGCGAQPTG